MHGWHEKATSKTQENTETCCGNKAPAQRVTCNRFLRHVSSVHCQRLVCLLAAKHKIHAVFGLGVAHFDQTAVDFDSEASLHHGCSSLNRDKVDKAEAATQIATAIAHNAHLPDAGAVS